MQVMQPSITEPSYAISGKHLGHLLAVVRSYTSKMTMLYHPWSMAAWEKQELLSDIYVQKTITLRLANHFLLVSGLGDFHLNRYHYQALARILGLSTREAKQREINPATFPAREMTGLDAGMVSPFLPPRFLPTLPITAIVLAPPPPLNNNERVGISLSLRSSLLFPANRLADLVLAYNMRYNPHIPVLQLNREE